MSQPNLVEQSDDMTAVDDEPTLEQAQPEIAIPTQKQKTDIYTVMLIISLICLVVACFLLVAELNRWGSFPGRPWDASDATPNVQAYHDDTSTQYTVV